jgi:hypothetical protein
LAGQRPEGGVASLPELKLVAPLKKKVEYFTPYCHAVWGILFEIIKKTYMMNII